MTKVERPSTGDPRFQQSICPSLSMHLDPRSGSATKGLR
jgi:hypothetical protein